tara:strand:- start:380 stop:637 length:258 start_codon:yes stop_codon:yes gene_type:complete
MVDKEKQIQEGHKAKELLENPMVSNALNNILNEGYQSWISTEASDSKARETLYHQQIAALKFKQVLINTIENGTIISEQIKTGAK